MQNELTRQITINGRNFYKDGNIHYIHSGAVHYFRILPECWYDRLLKMKNCGLNAVETYVCWSLHERSEGVFDFKGRLDLGRFIDLAASLDLDVIIRPGPYICAETDFGGMPSWLLNYKDIGLRSNDSVFMEKVSNYFGVLAEIIVPRLVKNGGRVQMIQIENEYGSYGNDSEYKESLVKLWKTLGVDTLFFTADGAEYDMLQNGGTDGVLRALTFGSRPTKNFEELKRYPDQPAFCAEYWSGWFNTYGNDPYICDPDKPCRETDEFIDLGASFNYYMFCGGTNYGMINGANFDNDYMFQTTSYDYNAPISEAGDMTDKYYSIKEELEKRTGKKISLDVKNTEKKAYPSLKASGFCELKEYLAGDTPVKSATPKSFESLGVDFGYVYYSLDFDVWQDSEMKLMGLFDRATITVDGKVRGVMGQGLDCNVVRFSAEKDYGRRKLGVLVENRGRCNYGPRLKDPKGLHGGVLLHDKFLMNYENYPLRAEINKKPIFGRLPEDSCRIGFYKFDLLIGEEPCDTFVYPSGFNNGCVYVNGTNIGRLCNCQPPQRTLYVAKELLKKGENEIIVFDTDGTDNPEIEFSDKPFYFEEGKKRV